MAHFRKFARQLWNPKSGLRKTVRKIGGHMDQVLMTTSRALRAATPALAAAGVPGLPEANAALGGYEKLREALKNK